MIGPRHRRVGSEPGVPRGAYKGHKQDQFLDAFAKMGFVYQAADAVGINPATIRMWRKKYPEFDAQFLEAERKTTELLERSALQRAIIGEARGIYHNGKRVATEMEKSDTLTIFLLKARDRRKYGDRLVHDVQIRFASGLLAEVMKSLRVLPTICPHCQTRLDLKEKIGSELKRLSLTFEPAEYGV